MADNIVEIENLTIRYGKLVAVDDVSFSIERGQVFGFIGPNGAGKSSTIRTLATLQKPNEARCRYAGTM